MFRKMSLAALILVTGLGFAGVSSAQFTDHYETLVIGPPNNTGTVFDFALAEIPAGFFEPGSAPFSGQVHLGGTAIDPGNLGRSDTLITRVADPFDRVDLPSPTPVMVDIQIVALNLQSTEPIQVIVSGQPTTWDVRVDLGAAPQQQGQLQATKTHNNGGIFDALIPVVPVFTFTKVTQPGLQPTLTITPPIVLDLQGGAWVHDLHPPLNVFDPGGAAFIPGVEEITPGIPASQQRVPMLAQSVPNPSLPVYQHTLTAPKQALHLPALAPGSLATLALLLLGSALFATRSLRRSGRLAEIA